jgi:hypothetical protein
LPSLSNTPLASRAWRLQKLYTIKDANGKIVPFVPNLAQRTFYNRRHTLNHVLKARKMGFSTLFEMENADALLFTPNLTAGIIDYKLDDAKSKLEMVRLAYERLDDGDLHPETWRIGAQIKRAVRLTSCSSQQLVFSNGSRISCSTSFRGGTPNRLHVSELGKTSIAAPIKAAEIRDGAFNSITPGNVIDIESTHEGGRVGLNYNLMRVAMSNDDANLTANDFRFHFFAWWQDPRYVIDAPNFALRPSIVEYFAKLSAETGRTFSHAQMVWYDTKHRVQNHAMKKEYPSTAGEAFEAINDHAIYGKQMADLRAAGRICDFLPEANWPLFTFWDIGLSDYGVMWLIQPVGRAFLVLDWHEISGRSASHFADQVRRWEAKYDRPIARHFLPHDAETRDRGTGKTYAQTLRECGITNITVVPRTPDVWLGIGYTRDILPHCWFHKTTCDTARNEDGLPYQTGSGEEFPSGVACLEGYQRNITASGDTLREMPKHDLFSHSADGFRTFGEAWRRGMVNVSDAPQAQPKAISGHTPRTSGPRAIR